MNVNVFFLKKKNQFLKLCEFHKPILLVGKHLVVKNFNFEKSFHVICIGHLLISEMLSKY